MRSYLIPYTDPKKNDGEEDPMLSEYTYGDSGDRGRWLKDFVEKGDYLFFHTNLLGRNCLTGYYYVEKVCSVKEAIADEKIMSKYKNPHLLSKVIKENETIIFGHPIYSKELSFPMPISKAMLASLSKKPKSIARPWPRLNEKDIKLLLKEIKKFEDSGYLEDKYLMTEEIGELLESDIENFLHKRPDYISENLKEFDRQRILNSGKRIDLLFKQKGSDNYVLVEIKNSVIGREVYAQLNGYLKELREELGAPVKGVIVCKGILPIVEGFYKGKMHKEGIEVYFHTWKFALNKLEY